MAIIKHIAVHHSPQNFLKYILKGEKTNGMKFATGLNCSANAESAYKEFKMTFEKCTGRRFYKKSLDSGKELIRLHHYIQSFKPNEVTPEEAHRIGLEWAKKVFGNKHQVLVTTHVDREHIHNHFAVAAYDLKGKKWYGNFTTLNHCRDISDKICKIHGLNVIKNPNHHTDMKYNEWLARKTSTSWKQKLCDDIDRLVLRDDVRTIEDLVRKLSEGGYEVRYGKYISVKPKNFRKAKAVRTLRLGDGYGIEELQYRIENKDKEYSLPAIAKYQGIQREYALCLRELQITLYRKPNNIHKVTYKELRKNAELLTFLCEKKITSKEEFENVTNSAADKADKLKEKRRKILADIEDREKILQYGERYIELDNIRFPTGKQMQELTEMKFLDRFELRTNEDIEKYRQELDTLKSELPKAEEELQAAEKEKSEITSYYQTYLQQMQSDYDYVLEKLKCEREEQEQSEEQQERSGRRYKLR